MLVVVAAVQVGLGFISAALLQEVSARCSQSVALNWVAFQLNLILPTLLLSVLVDLEQRVDAGRWHPSPQRAPTASCPRRPTARYLVTTVLTWPSAGPLCAAPSFGRELMPARVPQVSSHDRR